MEVGIESGRTSERDIQVEMYGRVAVFWRLAAEGTLTRGMTMVMRIPSSENSETSLHQKLQTIILTEKPLAARRCDISFGLPLKLLYVNPNDFKNSETSVQLV